MINAIAAGIINESMKQKLEKLEEEKNRLENENIKLKLKSNSKITPEIALNFLNSMIDVDNNTFSYKKRLIQRFVNKVILYNDRMDIYLIAVNELTNIDSKIEECTELENNNKLLTGNGCLILQCYIN